MERRHEYTPTRKVSPRCPADLVTYCDDWRDHASQPPAQSLRGWDSVPYEYMPVKQFATSVQADVVYKTLVLPRNSMYKPSGIDVYLGWVPGASWTSGNYSWKLGYLGKARNGATLGSGSHAEVELDVTPDDATTLREDKITSISVADAIEVITFRFYIGVGGSTADDVGEMAWIRFAYTAWRNGGRMHPGTISQ